jgi:hypothetical protein
MNADKRRLKRIGLSVFIGVNRRLKMPFSDFFSAWTNDVVLLWETTPLLTFAALIRVARVRKGYSNELESCGHGIKFSDAWFFLVGDLRSLTVAAR